MKYSPLPLHHTTTPIGLTDNDKELQLKELPIQGVSKKVSNTTRETKTRSLEEILVSESTATVTSKHSLSTSQINIKPHTKSLSTSDCFSPDA